MEVIKEHLEEKKKRTLRCFISISIYLYLYRENQSPLVKACIIYLQPELRIRAKHISYLEITDSIKSFK